MKSVDFLRPGDIFIRLPVTHVPDGCRCQMMSLGNFTESFPGHQLHTDFSQLRNWNFSLAADSAFPRLLQWEGLIRQFRQAVTIALPDADIPDHVFIHAVFLCKVSHSLAALQSVCDLSHLFPVKAPVRSRSSLAGCCDFVPCFLSVPGFGMVQPRMFIPFHDLQVTLVIVVFIAVDVVHHFVRLERPSQHLLGYQDMDGSFLPVDHDIIIVCHSAS